MMDISQLFASLLDGVPELFSGSGNWLGKLGINVGELGTGGTAVLLGLVWYFVRVIRMVVSILFTLCVLLLVLQLLGYVDLGAVLTWLRQVMN